MMAQGVLGFKYEEEKGKQKLTALGGLPLYSESPWQSVHPCPE